MTHAPSQPWRDWPLGVRVVVRRHLPEGGYSDVLGDLLASGPDGVTVRSRHGDVEVRAEDIAIGKIIPPRASRAPRT